MSQKKIFMPTKGAISWKQFLAEPEKQWKDGYSAKSVADAWEKFEDAPVEITSAFDLSPELAGAELVFAIPEFRVSLPGSSIADSQNDVFAIFSNDNNLIVTTVEAKYREPFGNDSLEQWFKGASEGKIDRWDSILGKIRVSNVVNESLRYQLFHRLASAVIMAEKFHAKHSMMIIQSFEEDDMKNHYRDFVDFLTIYKKKAAKEMPIELIEENGFHIWAMWVNS